MTDIPEGKRREAVEQFDLEVLGGTFSVREVVADQSDGPDELLRFIRDTPTDRWFVMLAEGEGASKDVLALIDDQFEFQPIALGTLDSE